MPPERLTSDDLVQLLLEAAIRVGVEISFIRMEPDSVQVKFNGKEMTFKRSELEELTIESLAERFRA